MRPPDRRGRVAAVFFGSGTFAMASLQRAAEHPELALVAVVTAPARPVGRKATLTPTPVAVAAHELGIGAVLTPTSLRDENAVASILDLSPAIAILADYGRIIPTPLLALNHGALNLHPSLLPRHRGATPIQAAILAGDTETGVTLFRMDEGLDTGPIVAQERVAIPSRPTTPELEARLAAVAADVLERSLDPWLSGDLPAVPQSADGATTTRPLRRDDGRVDPSLPAGLLERMVRAYRPWPGTFLVTPAGRLAVLDASTGPMRPGDQPGTLVTEDGGLALVTADGRLILDRVQPAAGRPMPGSAFRRGHPGIVGMRVESA
jgi:methionyl-tRNA formyltransferase